VRQDLAGRGVRVDESGRRAGATVCVCAQPDALAPGVVARLAADGHRLLVVVGAVFPPSELTWDLLAGGASDVVSWRPADQPGAAVHSRLLRWNQIEETVGAPLVRRQLVGWARVCLLYES
jgi:hypothetical protein